MEYRKIGTTGMSASVIGLGGEHLDGKPYERMEETVNAAYENGVNIIDLFMPGDEVRSNFGKALEGRRKEFLIQGHIGSADIHEQYDITRDLPTCQRYFEQLLKHLKTDYIDIGMLFFIDTEEHFNQVFHSDIVNYAQKLKRDGVIRAIGASSHNPKIAKKVVETGIVELLMFSINPAFDMTPEGTDVLDTLDPAFADDIYRNVQPDRMELYRLCEQKNVAITVMKTLGAGKLLSKEHTPFQKPLTVAQCIHYALTRPAVVSSLIGASSRDEMMQALRYLDLSGEERDYADAVAGLQKDFEGHCVYCSHCQPCPAGIDIAAVNKYLDIAKLDEKSIPPSVAQHYAGLEKTGADCIGCASCEERCPFRVPVIKNMEYASRLFGK